MLGNVVCNHVVDNEGSFLGQVSFFV